MNTVVLNILSVHGLAGQFADAAVTSGNSVWSAQIRSKDGSSAFSRPLVVARQGIVVRLAHFTVGEYDIEYNPLVELSIQDSGEWIPLTIFTHYTGHKTVGEDISLAEAQMQMDEWAAELDSNGYGDPTRAVAQSNQQGLKAKL
ncbi:hypothetical protein BC831DRAFT_398879 [Entophlyctis helioformis]|nr:hypothetical protein BC831DRAFT_398879 [Entophlyctis helioformis]